LYYSVKCIKTSVRIHRKVTSRAFPTEFLAAEAYDKLVLFLYGSCAKLNFPDKREEFLSLNLNKFYLDFCDNYYQSVYNYVSPDAGEKKWRVRMDTLGLKDDLKVPFQLTERLAAEVADQFIHKYNLKKDLNFSFIKYDLDEFDINIEKWKKSAIRTSKIKGLTTATR
jgi:hypothetical protein